MLTPKDFQIQHHKMGDFYIDTEKQFLDLIRIIPLDNPDETYSPRLYNVLQSSCSQVENLMRLLCEKFSLKYENTDFPAYHKLLNVEGIMDKQWIYCTKTDSTLYPFEIETDFVTPFWWRGYNGTKHKLPDGLKQGNIKNTLFALSASYTLQCMAYFARFSENNFLKDACWINRDVLLTGDKQVVRDVFDSRPHSDLFYHQTVFSEDRNFT